MAMNTVHTFLTDSLGIEIALFFTVKCSMMLIVNVNEKSKESTAGGIPNNQGVEISG